MPDRLLCESRIEGDALCLALLNDFASYKKAACARPGFVALQPGPRARALAWPEGEQKAQAAPMDEHMAHLAFSSPELNAHPAAVRSGDELPLLNGVQPATNARLQWQNYCAGCHGPRGRGDGPAAEWLRPLPANLVEHRYNREYVLTVLWNGIAGTSMPAWRDQPAANLLERISSRSPFSTAPFSRMRPAASRHRLRCPTP